MKTKKEIEELLKSFNCCIEYDISIRSREIDVLCARQAFINYARYNSYLSTLQIGKIIKRNHATVLNSIKNHEKLLNGFSDKAMVYKRMWGIINDLENDPDAVNKKDVVEYTSKEDGYKDLILKRVKAKYNKTVRANHALKDKIDHYITENASLKAKIIRMQKEFKRNGEGKRFKKYNPPIEIIKDNPKELRDNFGIYY